MKRALIAALVSFLLVSGIAATAAEDELDRTKLGEFVPSSTPFPAPAVSLTDAAGHSLDLAELRGKVVVVNLWATWCEPCLREMPSLERLQSRFGERIEVLAVSEDRGGDKTVAPACHGRQAKAAGHSAAWPGCRRQRPDRACPLLGAAVA